MNNVPMKWTGSDEKVFEIEEIQKPKLNQSVKILTGDGHVTINQWGNTGNVNAAREAVTDRMLLDYIETFSQPRLHNFLCHLYAIAERRFQHKLFTAKWLGITARTLFRYNGTQEDLSQGISLATKEGILSLLERYRWNQTEVARKMDIPLGNLRSKMKKFGIRWKDDDNEIDSAKL